MSIRSLKTISKPGMSDESVNTVLTLLLSRTMIPYDQSAYANLHGGELLLNNSILTYEVAILYYILKGVRVRFVCV